MQTIFYSTKPICDRKSVFLFVYQYIPMVKMVRLALLCKLILHGLRRKKLPILTINLIEYYFRIYIISGLKKLCSAISQTAISLMFFNQIIVFISASFIQKSICIIIKKESITSEYNVRHMPCQHIPIYSAQPGFCTQYIIFNYFM